MDRQQDVIRRITAHVVAYRFTLENERNSRMAIEIKGLKADALTARANLDKLRAAYAKFNEAAPAHAADVEGLATTIGGMQSDLEFAATVMGNSAGESEKLAHGDSKEPVTTPRVALGPHPDQPEGKQQVVKNESDIPRTVPMPVFAHPSPEVMPETTEGAIWFKTPAAQEVEKPAAATFRAAE